MGQMFELDIYIFIDKELEICIKFFCFPPTPQKHIELRFKKIVNKNYRKISFNFVRKNGESPYAINFVILSENFL